ncbi:MAG: hypothetical protein LBP59_20595 [Planctomycetaceae bacterium]|nr:hypothetical protein [Planctomycetaceae bacterium]
MRLKLLKVRIAGVGVLQPRRLRYFSIFVIKNLSLMSLLSHLSQKIIL